MKRLLFSLSLAAALCLCACNRPDGSFYKLVGGDDSIDWIQFINDSTLRWVGPGPRLLESTFFESDSVIVVQAAPLSRGFLRRLPDGSLLGVPPFFEGRWVQCVPPRGANKEYIK